jgi:hypothetical protein
MTDGDETFEPLRSLYRSWRRCRQDLRGVVGPSKKQSIVC